MTFPTQHVAGALYGTLGETACKQEISLAYLQAVATATRSSMEFVRVDYQQVDATIRQTAAHPVFDMPVLDVQLKCTSQDVFRAEHVSWVLERKHYDSLRNTRRMAPIILVLVVVPEDFVTWLTINATTAMLEAKAYWVCLQGEDEIDQDTMTVTIPYANVFNIEALLDILNRIGQGGMP